jgi:hypothetical protein
MIGHGTFSFLNKETGQYEVIGQGTSMSVDEKVLSHKGTGRLKASPQDMRNMERTIYNAALVRSIRQATGEDLEWFLGLQVSHRTMAKQMVLRGVSF